MFLSVIWFYVTLNTLNEFISFISQSVSYNNLLFELQKARSSLVYFTSLSQDKEMDWQLLRLGFSCLVWLLWLLLFPKCQMRSIFEHKFYQCVWWGDSKFVLPRSWIASKLHEKVFQSFCSKSVATRSDILHWSSVCFLFSANDSKTALQCHKINHAFPNQRLPLIFFTAFGRWAWITLNLEPPGTKSTRC